MAGKWKMAKAFGRAVFGKNDKENPAAKMARDVYDRDLRNYTKDKDAVGRVEAFNRGNEEAWMDERSIVRGKDGRPDVKLESKDVVEARGDARLDDELRQDFDEAFEEAAENHGYKKWRDESKDMPLDDGFKGDLHDTNREDAVQRSREEIIKALQQNTDRDVTDVLRDFGYIFEE